MSKDRTEFSHEAWTNAQKLSSDRRNKLIFPNDPIVYEFDINDFEYQEDIGESRNVVKSYKFCPKQYKKEDKTFEVAVKCIPYDEDEDKRKRFVNEVHQLCELSNECLEIVNFYGIGLVQGLNQYWIIMQRMKTSLFHFLKSYQPFPEELLGCVVVSISDALSVLHKEKIIHRDIKNSNILIGNEGSIQLADFGNSRFFGDKPMNTITMTGTWYFMAPEILRGEQYGEKADIFSFGISLIECAKNKLPLEHIYEIDKKHNRDNKLSELQKWANTFDYEATLHRIFDDTKYSKLFQDFVEGCIKPVEYRASSSILRVHPFYQKYDVKRFIRNNYVAQLLEVRF